jgi:hypothetical protein
MKDPDDILKLFDGCPQCGDTFLEALTFGSAVGIGCWSCGWIVEPEPERPGPFSVEIWEIPGHWDAIDTVPDLRTAARLASRVVRRDWRVHGNEARVQILDARGRPC